MRRVIFGGSFDPPTNSHYDMGVRLAGLFDEVIVVPAWVSPFKPEGAGASGPDRLRMCRILFEDIPKVTVSDFEIMSGGTSYSYITAEHFAEEGVMLYYAIGSELLKGLPRWKNSYSLAKNAIFYIVPRPGFPVDEDELSAARKVYRVEVAPFTGAEGSSSLLRAAVPFGKAREVVMPSVADYIEANGLYRDYDYITSRYDEFGLKPSRREHIYRTAKAAIILAKLNGASTSAATRAALLHDITKYLTDEQCEAYGILTPEARRLPESCRHQATGAAAAEKLFGETDREVTDAIATHSTGAAGMTTLQKIIFAADYIEDGRDFAGVEPVRALTYENLDRGVLAIMENTLAYLGERGAEIAPATREAYEYLKEETKA